MYIAANMNPMTVDRKGRRFFAHSHIFLGSRKVKTGMFQVANCNDGSVKKAILSHLEDIAEDAMNYPWENVRQWSEEICNRVYERCLRWSDTHKIDNLCLRISQVHYATSEYANEKGLEGYSMSPEVASARAAPPCRQYNTCICHSNSDS